MWTEAQARLALVALSDIAARGCRTEDCLANGPRLCPAGIASTALRAIWDLDKPQPLAPGHVQKGPRRRPHREDCSRPEPAGHDDLRIFPRPVRWRGIFARWSRRAKLTPRCRKPGRVKSRAH